MDFVGLHPRLDLDDVVEGMGSLLGLAAASTLLGMTRGVADSDLDLVILLSFGMSNCVHDDVGLEAGLQLGAHLLQWMDIDSVAVEPEEDLHHVEDLGHLAQLHLPQGYHSDNRGCIV